jgi:hypothetical protein
VCGLVTLESSHRHGAVLVSHSQFSGVLHIIVQGPVENANEVKAAVLSAAWARYDGRAPHYCYMLAALSILARSSLSFSLYTAYLDGASPRELSDTHRLSVQEVEQRIEAVRLTLTMQVKLTINRRSSIF